MIWLHYKGQQENFASISWRHSEGRRTWTGMRVVNSLLCAFMKLITSWFMTVY